MTAFAASSASPSAAPTWIAISGTVSSIITALGVIIAGIFAFFKFSKGRTFHPKCSIQIDPQLIEIGESRALHVSVTVRNDGLTALLFPDETDQLLLVGQADGTIWRQACERQWPVVWEESAIPKIEYSLAVPDGNSLELATMGKSQDPPRWRWLSRAWLLHYLSGETLEPGEQWVRSTLVPVSSKGVAYLLRARVSACRHVGIRHVLRHRHRCCQNDSPSIFWLRDVFLLPTGKDKNEHSAL
jgi:hypothetical protein